jgi:regulator of replication initiation timing
MFIALVGADDPETCIRLLNGLGDMHDKVVADSIEKIKGQAQEQIDTYHQSAEMIWQENQQLRQEIAALKDELKRRPKKKKRSKQAYGD